MKKFFARIRQFLRNIFGYTNEVLTIEVIGHTAEINGSMNLHLGEIEKKIEALTVAINSGTMEQLNGLNGIFNLFSQRPIVPLIMNDKGYLLNLAVEKKMKMECTSDGDIVSFKIVVDHTHTFMNVEVNLKQICIENINTEAFKEQLPIMQQARVMLKNGEKKSALLDRIALIAMSKVVVRSQHQLVDQAESFYLFADTILTVVKPIYDADKAKEEATKKANETGTGINHLKAVPEDELKGISDNVNIQEPQNENTEVKQNETALVHSNGIHLDVETEKTVEK
jgi:hypothetical protein